MKLLPGKPVSAVHLGKNGWCFCAEHSSWYESCSSVLWYNRAVSSNLLFLLGAVGFEALFVCFSEAAWSIVAHPSKVFPAAINPAAGLILANGAILAHCGQTHLGRMWEQWVAPAPYFTTHTMPGDWLKSTAVPRLCWLTLNTPRRRMAGQRLHEI